MEFSTAIAADAGFSKFLLLLPRHSPAAPTTLSILAISAAGFLPVDSAAAVRSEPYRPSVPRALVRRTRCTIRKSLDGGEDGFSGDGVGDDGPFGGGRGGNWNFGGNGESNWEESGNNSSSSSDPAFNFVYEVILWIALSNCTHFAFKKMGRIFEGRGKVVPIRLVPSMC